MAQEYSSKCNWGHNHNRVNEAKALGYPKNTVGENLFATSANSVEMADVVNTWDNQKENIEMPAIPARVANSTLRYCT